MAVYLIMVDGKKIARLDQHIHDQIVNLVSHEKPVLVCLNQMSRYKDYCGPAEETKKQLQAVKDLVIKDADGACGPLEVCATEFIDYDEHLREINVKGLEYVSRRLTSDVSVEVMYSVFRGLSFCGLCMFVLLQMGPAVSTVVSLQLMLYGALPMPQVLYTLAY